MAAEQHDPRALAMMPYFPRSAEIVRYRDVELPAQFEVLVTHPEWPTKVSLLIRVDPDTGPVLAGTIAEDQPATQRDVEAAIAATGGLENLLTRAAMEAAKWLAGLRLHGPDADLATLTAGERAEFDALLSHPKWAHEVQPKLRPQRRRRMTRKLLKEVAEVYRAALAEGEAPTVAVREHFVVSHSTAARWVGEARRAGELGQAIGPTPGEAADGGAS